MWGWRPVGCDTVSTWVVPNIKKERDTFIFRVEKFKNAGNILSTTPHHIPGKLNHQHHCSDSLRSHTMCSFSGTWIHYCIMACLWTFTLSYMNRFCNFKKCFIQIHDDCKLILFLKLSHTFTLSCCLLYCKFIHICSVWHTYTTLHYIFLFVTTVIWWTSPCNYLHPAVCPPSYIW